MDWLSEPDEVFLSDLNIVISDLNKIIRIKTKRTILNMPIYL